LSLTLKEKYRLAVFENGVLREIFRSKREKENMSLKGTA
jgi:hypothetical protein